MNMKDAYDIAYDLFYQKRYLEAINLASGDDIYHLLIFTGEGMQGYGKDAELITDDNPILEFSTVKNVFYQKSQEIISDLVKNIEENKKWVTTNLGI